MLLSIWQEIFTAVWVFTSAALAIAYVYTVEKYRNDWNQLPDWQPRPDIMPSTKISVIIPARNESAKLIKCLSSIAKQSYPTALFEVVLVDDHSQDMTFSLAQEFAQSHPNLRVFSMAEHENSKKTAIEKGIALATGELIVCTDADCELPPDWLHLIAAFFEEKKAKFIAAPVSFHQSGNALQRFQSLDFLGMMGVTGAGFQGRSGLLSNGANLAYPKAVFSEVNGFDGIGGLASGDDMLLLHKIAARYPDGIFFLKNRGATVRTDVPPNLRSFISQRLRWASKSRSYTDCSVTLRLGLVFLFCWAILLNLLLAGWLGWPLVALSLCLILVKTVADFRFLGTVSRYFERQDLMQGYLLSQVMHVAYIIGIGTLANVVRRYEWKGRRVR